MKRLPALALTALLLSGCGGVFSGISAPEDMQNVTQTETQTETSVSDTAETASDTIQMFPASGEPEAAGTQTAADDTLPETDSSPAQTAPSVSASGTAASASGTAASRAVTSGTHTAPAVSDAFTAAEIAAMAPGTVLDPAQISPDDLPLLFTAQPIPDDVFARMDGVSYHENEQITPDGLRYLRMLHINPDGMAQIGEMVTNSAIAEDILEIFTELYKAAYPIERMVLVDCYGGDDNASMAANNTSCFNYRTVPGTATLSYHARGLAVDVNPRYNPYITYAADGTERILPENGAAYADRSADYPMKITADDLCCRLFLAHGFTWGGNWRNSKDYQHFEKRTV